MKHLFKFFGVEIQRLLWITILILITLLGFVGVLVEIIPLNDYFVGVCIISSVGYISSILTKSKKEELSSNIKKLLIENKDGGSPVGLEPELDKLNKVMKDAAPLLEMMNKYYKISNK